MNPAERILFFPKALRDLQNLDAPYARQILEDLRLLEKPPWPPGKIKKLRGCDLWEVKTGDYRALFLLHQRKAVVVRVVNRRDLERSIRRIDPALVFAWLSGAPYS